IRTSGRYNIICDQVLIDGTIRSMNPDIRQFVHKRIKELAGNIAAAYRGTTGVTIEDGYAVVDNNRRITEQFINAAGRILGAESVHTDISPSLIGEDF
ncbi:amidohydrolase, partial [[Clostridium] symbiosum]|nr:amidohydrolase [[Clostridium] symbiosum]